MDDYSSRRQKEGEWHWVFKGRNNHQQVFRGHSKNPNFQKDRSNATSFFITNFPKDVTAEILWNRCKEFGHVVDVYVPNKLSKARKRFGFVRFLNVKCNRSLVWNLRSIWFGNHRLFADEVKPNNRIIKADKKKMPEEEGYEREVPIPFDIQLEIMKRLPIKSLLKFMSVSKQWKSIIQSPQFINAHIQPPRRHLFPCYDFNYGIDIFNNDTDCFLQRLVPPLTRRRSDFIGYSQGLFGSHYYKDRVLGIWNPSLRKSVFIPVPSELINAVDKFCFTAVCGYNNNATDEPTILGITYESRLQVHIHTLTSGVWRTFSDTTSRESIYFTSEVIIDRFIYWIASGYNPEGDALNDHMIVSCDVTSEQFIELCLPPCLATSPYTLDLYKLRKSLVVVESEHSYKQDEFGVWMMMMMEPGGVQNSFTKLYTVKIPYTSGMFPPSVLGFRKDGQLMLQKNDSLFSYEPDLKRFNEFKNIPGKTCYSWLADSYTETLLLLDHPDCISCYDLGQAYLRAKYGSSEYVWCRSSFLSK